MKIVLKSPLNFLATVTYTISGGKVLIDYKSLRREYSNAIDISSIKSSYTYKMGDDAAWNLFLFFMVIDAIMRVAWKFVSYGNQPDTFSFLFLAASIFCLIFAFRKRTFVGFKNEKDNVVFAVEMNDKPEVKKFIEEIADAAGITV